MNEQMSSEQQTPDRLERPFEDYSPEELFGLFTPPKPGRVEATTADLTASPTENPSEVVSRVLAEIAHENLESGS